MHKLLKNSDYFFHLVFYKETSMVNKLFNDLFLKCFING